jgi:hypothetical protein
VTDSYITWAHRLIVRLQNLFIANFCQWHSLYVYYVRVKTQYGQDFYELSIMLGTIELLAVGGFHGNAVSSTQHAFLGSVYLLPFSFMFSCPWKTRIGSCLRLMVSTAL